MPTTEHEVLVDLFRDNPRLAPRLLKKLFGLEIPVHTEVTVGESTLTQSMAVEFRADVVLEVKNFVGESVLSIIVEVQRDQDERKKWSWPVYASVQRSKKRCPVIVMVVATNAAVAQWSSKPIDLGFGLTMMRPLVLGPAVIPVMTDPVAAARDPELAFLSALSHDAGESGLDVVQTAALVLGNWQNELAPLFFEVLYNHVREPLKRAIEAMIMEGNVRQKPYKFPPFAQALVDRGVVEGELKGELKRARIMLLRLVQRAGIDLTEEQRVRIETCTDLELFDHWADNVIGAKTASDIFG